MKTTQVDDLIVSDLESNVLPSRDSAGKRVFSTGESFLLRRHQNDIYNMKIGVSNALNVQTALEAEVPIAQNALSDRMIKFNADKSALIADIDKVNSELSTKEAQLNALDGNNNKVPVKSFLRGLKNMGLILVEEAIMLLTTFSLLSYAFSTRTILFRSMMIVAIGVFAAIQNRQYEKSQLKSVHIMYKLTLTLSFFALISAIVSCFIIKFEKPATTSFSMNLVSEPINSNSDLSVLSFLKYMWLSAPGIFAVLLGFAFLIITTMLVSSHKPEKSTVSRSASDRLIGTLSRDIKILSQERERLLRDRKILELAYKSDCEYINGELECLKEDILAADKEANAAKNKLSETFTDILNEISDYDRDLKSMYERYWQKNMPLVSTTEQDIQYYYNNI